MPREPSREREITNTHEVITHRQTRHACTLRKRLRGEEKLSSTNHPQLGNKEQAKPHKMCHCSLTYTDPAEQKTKHNLVAVGSLPRPSLMKEGSGEWAGVEVQLQRLNLLLPVLSRHSQVVTFYTTNENTAANKNSSREVSVSD